MNQDAKPTLQQPRDIPFHLREKVKKKIDYFVKTGIMEWTKPGEPIIYASPLVIAAKGEDDVRITADFRIANKGVSRTRIVPGLRIDELQTSFANCTIFSKLDCNNGYHQLHVDAGSKKYLVVTTPWGNLYHNTLAQGWKTSQDEFDRRINEILNDMPRVKANRDDILVGGKNWTDHNNNLQEVLSRLKDYGLTLKREKCEFGRNEIEFYGVCFTANGIKPPADKIKALNNCGPPASKEGVKSFLQMVGYMSRFIRGFSQIAAPLRSLTKKNTTFIWERRHQEAFVTLKNSLNEQTNLAYFIPGNAICMHVDAGKKATDSITMSGGLCSILCQKDGHGDWRMIHIANRGITDAESRYGQTELESAAIRYGCDIFRKYLVGAPEFIIYTDCRPLQYLYNNPKSKAPLRIEKHILDVQGLDYTVVYKKGIYNIADYGTRHVVRNTVNEDVVRYVNRFERDVERNCFKPDDETDENIHLIAKDDDNYQFLIHVIENDRWTHFKSDRRLKGYIGNEEKLSVVNEMIYFNDLLVPPKRLQKKFVDEGHKLAHSGEIRTHTLLRDRLWFPGISSYCKEIVKNCLSCQLTNDRTHDEPLESMELPPSPWHTIAIDFKGPLTDGTYALVGYDLYSRYPVVDYCRSTKFSNIKPILDKWFAAHGTPRKVKSDNGPPFKGHEFKRYAKEQGFKHKRIKPRHPRGNGDVERFMRTFKKCLRIAEIEKAKYRTRIDQMLKGYRATIHPATGYTPFELLFGRKMRLGMLPDAKPSSISHEQLKAHNANYKGKSKFYHDKRRNAKMSNLLIGDRVAMKNMRSDTLLKILGHIEDIQGNAVTVTLDDGRVYIRDKSHIKKLPVTAARLDDGRVFIHDNSYAKKMPVSDNSTSKPHAMDATPSSDEGDDYTIDDIESDMEGSAETDDTDHIVEENDNISADEINEDDTPYAVQDPEPIPDDNAIPENNLKRQRRPNPRYFNKDFENAYAGVDSANR